MREVTEEILEDYPLEKITKFVLNKTLESETIAEGVIVNTTQASVILRGVSDSSKGKELKESKHINGTLLVKLDENNYNILVGANYEYTQSEAIKGNKAEDLYKFIAKDGANNFIVEL